MMDAGYQPLPWWKFPFKPVRVQESIFKSLNPSDYVMEKKYDGWRALLIVGRTAELWTREKTRIEMPENLASQVASLRLPEGTVLDGEIWNPNKRGSWRHARTVRCMLTFWDVIRTGRRDVSSETLVDRGNELARLLGEGTDDVRRTERLEASEEAWLEVKRETLAFRAETGARSGFIHGAVLKRKASPRRDHAVRSAEHPDWLKLVLM